jgi:hypothetical protein
MALKTLDITEDPKGKWVRMLLSKDIISRMSEVKRHLSFKENVDIYEYEMQQKVISKGIQAYEKELGINKPQPVAQS